MPTGSAATVASALRTMSRTLLPDLSPARRTVHGRSGITKPPYLAGEIADLYIYASRLPRPKTRRYILSLLYLGLGAGAIDGEQNLARIDEVTTAPDGTVSVVLHRAATELQRASSRTVTVLEPYGHLLADLASDDSVGREVWLLGGGAQRRNRSSTLLEETVGHVTPAIDMYRLRSTYLLDLTHRRFTIAELLAAGGVTTLAAFDRVLALQAASVVSPSPAPFAVIDGEGTAADDSGPDALDAPTLETEQAS
jgi:hypothetical protein